MKVKSRILTCALAVAALPIIPAHLTAAIIIQPDYDVSFTSNPNFAALQTTVNNAIAIYASQFANNLTIPITFKLDDAVSGAQSSYFTTDYAFSDFRTALINSATTAADQTVIANIGAGPNDPVLNAARINVSEALAFTLGLGSSVANYGSVTFNKTTYQSNPAGLLGVMQHEINEVLGTSSNLPNGNPPGTAGTLPSTIFPADLFRYNANGTRNYSVNATSDAANRAYFRLGPAGANLQEWNNLPNGGDYGDWAGTGSGFAAAPQDAFGDASVFTSMSVSTAELSLLDAVGYALVPEPSEWALASGLALIGFAGWHRRRTSAR